MEIKMKKKFNFEVRMKKRKKNLVGYFTKDWDKLLEKTIFPVFYFEPAAYCKQSAEFKKVRITITEL